VIDIDQAILGRFVKNCCGFLVALPKPFMALPCATTKAFQEGEGIFIGRNVLREMQTEEDRSGRSDYSREDREGTQHATGDLPCLWHQDDQVHQVARRIVALQIAQSSFLFHIRVNRALFKPSIC
jgi:hypothetical protein